MPAKKTGTKKTKNKARASRKSPRKLPKQNYRSFRLHKRIRHDDKPLPKARHLFSAAIRHIWRHKKLFLGILLVQLIFTLIFVTGFGLFSSDLGETKSIVQDLLGPDSTLYTGATLLGILVTSGSGQTSEVGNLYGMILLLINSLAIIWALRKTHAKTAPRLKEAYYQGMYPLIPFILVTVVILLQLLPLVIGNALYSIVISNGIAVTGLEQAVWLLLFIGLALLSIYMITSSLFALYIVTLPDVRPLQALRSARQLVLHRRMMVARKLVFLPVVLLVLLAVMLLPIVIYVTPIAEVAFFVLGNAGLLIGHAYSYELYRELL
ncbi:MAG: hypothetical protein U5L95_03055 [Candidatus Saccharibacteria bacterium]|nr:hypothetical protein [Candidatus Saccharibacteria bacterium]